MPSYRYRALNGSGELVSGAMAGPSAAEVTRRIEGSGLVLIDALAADEAAAPRSFGLLSQPRAEDVAQIQRIYWHDNQPASVRSLASALGIPTPPGFVVFFPVGILGWARERWPARFGHRVEEPAPVEASG